MKKKLHQVDKYVSDLNKKHEGHLFIESKMNKQFRENKPTTIDLKNEQIKADYKFQEWINNKVKTE